MSTVSAGSYLADFVNLCWLFDTQLICIFDLGVTYEIYSCLHQVDFTAVYVTQPWVTQIRFLKAYFEKMATLD